MVGEGWGGMGKAWNREIYRNGWSLICGSWTCQLHKDAELMRQSTKVVWALLINAASWEACPHCASSWVRSLLIHGCTVLFGSWRFHWDKENAHLQVKPEGCEVQSMLLLSLHSIYVNSILQAFLCMWNCAFITRYEVFKLSWEMPLEVIITLKPLLKDRHSPGTHSIHCVIYLWTFTIHSPHASLIFSFLHLSPPSPPCSSSP